MKYSVVGYSVGGSSEGAYAGRDVGSEEGGGNAQWGGGCMFGLTKCLYGDVSSLSPQHYVHVLFCCTLTAY